MKLKRVRAIVLVAVCALFAYVVHRGANRSSDFKYPYGAARQLWKTGELHYNTQPRYPVSFHVLLAPLAGRSLGTAVAVWAALSFAAVAALPRVLAQLSGVEPRRQLAGWALAAPFVVDALVLGQSDPINLLLISTGLLAAKRGRGVRGAMLIGLAGMIKILPIVHWATLLARRRSRDVWAGISLSIVLGAGLMAAAAGWRSAATEIRAQLEWMRGQEQPWHFVARGSDLRPNNESLSIVLARTFGDLPSSRRDPRVLVLARLPLPLVWNVWRAILVLLGVGWLASLGPAARTDPARGWMGIFSLTSILMLAASPICWNHYFLWTLPAALFLIERRRLLFVLAFVSLLISASQTARGFGGHMLIALGLFALVVRDLRQPHAAEKSVPELEADPILPSENLSRERPSNDLVT